MKILIVDDETRVLKMLSSVLHIKGFEEVETTSSAEMAYELVALKSFDVVITDLKMPGTDGLELLVELKRRAPGTEVILMTAFAAETTARQALDKGALDYLVKPFMNQELFAILDQVKYRRGSGRNETNNLKEIVPFMGIVGQSPAVKKMLRNIDKIARSNAPLLILGETGTGKELVARATHNLSPRHQKPFIPVHCSAIPESLFESELFGYEPGAFTGATSLKKGRLELASGGTLFLDEIGDLPKVSQPKMLRFLQEHQFMRLGGNETLTLDARIISATNRNLEDDVKSGSFRDDLFYRLDVMTITVPPLRDRMVDLVLLIDHFSHQAGLSARAFGDEILDIFGGYSWPGNVRELKNVVEQVICIADGGEIQKEHLPEKVFHRLESIKAEMIYEEPETSTSFDENEKLLIERTLQETYGNKAAAAKLLGITRRKLYSRMEKHGINSKSGRLRK